MKDIFKNSVIFQIYDVHFKTWVMSPGWLINRNMKVGDLRREVKLGSQLITWETARTYSAHDYVNNLCRLVDDQTLEVICYLYNGCEVEELDPNGSNIINVDGKFYKKIDI